MKYGFILIIFLLSISCCKETVTYEGNTFIGKWLVGQIDSTSNISSSFRIVYHYDQTDTLVFNSDSTGVFSIGLHSLSRGFRSFSWSHDRLYNMLNFDFENGSTEAYIKSQLRNTIELYIWDYMHPSYIGARRAYYLKLEKLD